MEKNSSSGRETSGGRTAGSAASSWAPILFLSVLAILLAVAAGLFMRKSLRQSHEIEVIAEARQDLADQKERLLFELNEIEASYQELSAAHSGLNEAFQAQKEEIRRLRMQIHTEGSRQALAQYERQIKEMALQLIDYQEKLALLEEDNLMLSNENLQMKAALSQAASAQSSLQQEMFEMEEQMRRAAGLKIYGMSVVPLRETRRGDRETNRARRTDKLQLCFTIQENLLARIGEYPFFFRLKDPGGNLVKPGAGHFFQYDLIEVEASFRKDINYEGKEKAVCVELPCGNGLDRGTYLIEVYVEGRFLYTGRFELN